ncbi:MAG: aminoacyl-histidine dipeptidase [Ruminococcaceae bacterium]|jgi:dipeptidase D|nr:aminoacyl-histidine dipeptidase [Oscillospiraceae bacterium]
MAVLDHLEPRSVFHYFEELCAIPHGSYNTKQVSDWLVSFARARGLEHYQDAVNNVIIIREASAGYESAEPVILQGHMDMVCEKAPDCAKDMETEGLDLAVEGDTILARGTTLGGDDGIAVAMMLAVLDDETMAHPRVECVFTVDEEVGMEGAVALDVSPLRGSRLLNLDSEAEGIFTVSCAGGNRTHCVVPVVRAPFAGTVLTVTVDGLAGGHSGAEIHKGRANANTTLGRVLCAAAARTELRVISVSGGLKDNAIPVLSTAVVSVADAPAALAACAELDAALRDEYRVTDPAIRVTAAEGGTGTPMDAASSRKVVALLTCCPNGVQTMSADIEGLVQTSLNLGILTTADSSVEASFSVRSSVESQKQMLVDRLRCLTEILGGTVTISGDYPGWQYRPESPLRDLLAEVFTEQYGRAPVVEAIHAGLECGLFSGKLPGLDCVSVGPDMDDIHTFRERLHIASTQRLWAMVVEMLRRMK